MKTSFSHPLFSHSQKNPAPIAFDFSALVHVRRLSLDFRWIAMSTSRLPVESADFSTVFTVNTVSRQFSNTLINSMNSLLHLYSPSPSNKKKRNNIQKAHITKRQHELHKKSCRKTHHSERTFHCDEPCQESNKVYHCLARPYQSRHIAVTSFADMMYTLKTSLCTSSINCI